MKLRIRNPKRQQGPIRLHIEHLVLEGLPLADGMASRVRAAVEAELARRLETRGLAGKWQSGGAVPFMPGGELRLADGASPATLGAGIARAVHAGLGGGTLGATRKRQDQ